MLRLNISKSSEWIEVGPGVRLLCDPVSTAIIAACKRDAAVLALGKDAPEDEAAIAMAKAIARRVVRDWEGVGDEDDKPIAVSPEGIDALLDIWVIFDAFQSRFLAKWMLVEQEKNVSALSQNGTTAGVRNTARPAKARAKSARPKATRRKP